MERAPSCVRMRARGKERRADVRTGSRGSDPKNEWQVGRNQRAGGRIQRIMGRWVGNREQGVGSEE
eukprot:365265-Chlamydomonas_euryale.AAC.1